MSRTPECCTRVTANSTTLRWFRASIATMLLATVGVMATAAAAQDAPGKTQEKATAPTESRDWTRERDLEVRSAKWPIEVDIAFSMESGAPRVNEDAVNTVLEAIDENRRRLITLNFKGAPLVFSRLPRATREQMVDRSGDRIRDTYNTFVARQVNALIDGVRATSPGAPLAVKGIPFEGRTRESQAANAHYDKVIGKLSAFVASNSVVVGRDSREKSLVVRSFAESLRLADGRAVIYRANDDWRMALPVGTLARLGEEDASGRMRQIEQSTGAGRLTLDNDNDEVVRSSPPGDPLEGGPVGDAKGANPIDRASKNNAGGGPRPHDGGSGGGAGGSGGGSGTGGDGSSGTEDSSTEETDTDEPDSTESTEDDQAQDDPPAQDPEDSSDQADSNTDDPSDDDASNDGSSNDGSSGEGGTEEDSADDGSSGEDGTEEDSADDGSSGEDGSDSGNDDEWDPGDEAEDSDGGSSEEDSEDDGSSGDGSSDDGSSDDGSSNDGASGDGSSGDGGSSGGSDSSDDEIVDDPFAETITLGSGFAGRTEPGDAVGAPGTMGQDKTPVARWAVIPFQAVDENLEVGVIAFHANGIDYVDFSANGGPWARVHSMSVNPRTNCREYWANLEVPAEYDGRIELRARIMPKDAGTPLVLQQIEGEEDNHRLFGGFSEGMFSMFLWGAARYADAPVMYVANSGDDANPGTLEAPYRTLDRAADVLKSTGQCNGAQIVILEPGDYQSPDNIKWSDGDSWLVIRGADGLDPSVPATRINIRHNDLNGSGTFMKPALNLLRWVNIAFDHNDPQIYYHGTWDELTWYDHCYLYDVMGWTEDRNYGTVNTNGKGLGFYATDSYVHDRMAGLAGGQLIRNCLLEQISGDAFSNAKLVVASEVRTFHSIIPGHHSDLFQHFREARNRIMFDVRARDLDGVQVVFLGKEAYTSHGNIAVVDLVAEVVDGQNVLTQLGSYCEHILMFNVTVPDQGLRWRDDYEDPDQRFIANDVVLKNVVFGSAKSGDTYRTGLPESMYFLNSHVDSANRISESDEGVSNLSVGEIWLEYAPSSEHWTQTGPGVPLLLGSGIAIPGFVEDPVDKGHSNLN